MKMVSKFNFTCESIAVVYWSMKSSRRIESWSRTSLRAKSTADITPEVLNSEEEDVKSRNDKFWEQLTWTASNNKVATNSENITNDCFELICQISWTKLDTHWYIMQESCAQYITFL